SQGDSFGKMEVSSISSSGITMKNEDSISLSKGDVIDLMGNVKFKVADASVLRFYPFVEIKTETGDQLNIEMSDALIAGRQAEILVTARNVSVGGVEVFVGTTSIGTTKYNGKLTFTPHREGSFTVTASRTGYVSGSKEVDVVA